MPRNAESLVNEAENHNILKLPLNHFILEKCLFFNLQKAVEF